MPAVTRIALFAASVVSSGISGLGPVKVSAWRLMLLQITWNMAIPSFNS
jgi:hypothetical protein